MLIFTLFLGERFMTVKNLSLLLITLFIFSACGGGGGGSYTAEQTNTCSPSTTNLCITVSSSRKYVVQNSSSAGESQKTLTLNNGTYVFDQTADSNNGHPLIFTTTAGVAYTTGVTTPGTPGTDGKTQIVITDSTPGTLNYGCSVHEGMGGVINILRASVSEQVEFTETNKEDVAVQNSPIY